MAGTTMKNRTATLQSAAPPPLGRVNAGDYRTPLLGGLPTILWTLRDVTQ